MLSGIIKVRKKENPFEMIERETLQDTRLSLQALGLLVNVCSYPDSWEIHKTELYKRYPKNKETSVRSAWNELIELGYALEKKYRNGRKWSYEYAISTVPFTEEEKVQFMGTKEEQEQKNVQSLRTGFCSPQNEDLKMKTSKSSANIYNIKDNTHQDNTHKDNTHHHPVIEHFNQLQSNMIHEFIQKQKLDDDESNKLISKLKGKNFKHAAYIQKAYETIKSLPDPAKPRRTELLPEWFDQPDKPKHQNGTPEQIERDKVELEAMLEQMGEKQDPIAAKRKALKAKLDKLKGE